jgi:tRNA(Ile)-lysidine synthetase-like protein
VAATRRLRALTESLTPRLDFPEGPLLVALSGGADSSALAWLAVSKAPVRLAHVNHQWPDSDRMEEAAGGVAAALGLALEVVRVEAPRGEAGAREVRYRALFSRRGEWEWLLTGHTADDQAETVLVNLLRGTGLEGLAGIPARRGYIARPLLRIARSETRELATLAGLPWVDDPANDDPSHFRNRIRLQLLPRLEAEYNPAVRRHLTATAEIAAASIEEGQLIGELLPDRWRAPAGLLWALGKVKAVAAARQAVRSLNNGYPLSRQEATAFWSVVDRQASGAQLGRGLRVERAGPFIEIRPRPDG